jgi:hypothetical protein
MIPYIVIVVLIIILVITYNRSKNLKDDLLSETKLRHALMDTVTTYKNQRNELVSEKLTMQFNLKDKEFKNLELVQRIKETEKRNATLEKKVSVFAAALIDTKVTIDSLQKSKVFVSEKDSSITFTSPNPDTIKYNLKIKPVFAIKDIKPTLTFVEFSIPNKQYVEFHWRNNKKEGYPISFSTTNTNPYFITNNIESYAIPEMDKKAIKPTFWQKLGKGFKNWGSDAVLIGVGVVGTLLLVK